jgi:hypothetical protein
MSIVRVGLAETKNYAEGWSGIFGGKKKSAKPARAAKKKSKPAKKRSKGS